MSNELKRKIQVLRDNFEIYAEKNLKIKTKAGGIEPFLFNVPQKYINNIINEQKAKIRKVRIIILKGRQQGACLSPDTKVLKSDFEWIAINDVAVGDRLLSVDENFNGLTSSGRNQVRKMRVAIVEDKAEFKKELFEIVLDNGTILKSTGDHRWMSRQRGGDYVVWRDVNDLIVGDVLRSATYKPEDITRNVDDGWIGGVLDADGSCSTTGSPRISFSQVEGVILDKYKAYLDKYNIRFYETIDHRTKVGKYTKLGDKPVHCIRVDRFPDMVKLISRCNPIRFNKEGMYVGRKLSVTSNGFTAWPKIVSIRSLGISNVIDIQTSTKTYVAEGIVSHNSTYTEGRAYWFCSLQKGATAFILTHEQPATDNLFNMTKRYHENSHPALKPSTSASNSKEMVFDQLDSSFKVGTAGSKAVGRSGTIQFLHASEVGFWPDAESHFAGVIQCVPDAPGTEIILESTANGIGNKFHQLWMEAINGESEYVAVFIPWFWTPEYRKDAANFKPSEQEQKDMSLYGFDLEQAAWRRSKIQEMGIDLANQEYPHCWQDAFLASGRTVFDKNLTAEALKECWKPKKRMVLEKKAFVERDNGELRIWANPKQGSRYVIGADVAEGIDGGDYSVCDVIEVTTGHQVAQWHGHIAPDLFGELLYHIGKLYNNALLAVEANNHGLTTNIKLRDMQYANLYVQTSLDDRGSSEKETRKLGFATTSRSKPYIIDNLSALLREGLSGIACKETINEMQTYIILPNGSLSAPQNCNDDRVISYAIACYALQQCPAYKKK